MRHSVSLRTLGRCSGHPRLPVVTAPVFRGCVLAVTRWGGDAQAGWHREQSENPLWLCHVIGHGRNRDRELSVMWTCHVDVVHTRIIQAHLLGS